MSDNFWATSDGVDVTETVSKEGYDASGGGDFIIIPNKTNCLASVHSAEWSQDQSFNNYIAIRWTVVKPEVFENVNVFQKLWVKDDDPRAKDPIKKRDKAKEMLVAIDAICGGRLAKTGREPNDDDLALALIGKQAGITVMTYPDRDDKNKPAGNWVSAVWPKGGKDISDIKESPRQERRASGSTSAADDLDDEIPF